MDGGPPADNPVNPGIAPNRQKRAGSVSKVKDQKKKKKPGDQEEQKQPMSAMAAEIAKI